MNQDFEQLVHAFLDGSIDEEGRETLERLLAEDPALRVAYLKRAHVAAMLDEHFGDFEEEAAAEPRKPSRRLVLAPALAAAAAVILALPLGMAIRALAPGEPETSDSAELAARETETETESGDDRIGPIAPASGPETVFAAAVDISASMVSDGRRLAPLVDRVFAELETLDGNDRFNLVAVGRELHTFRSAPIVASRENLVAARSWIENMSPETADRPEWGDPAWRSWRDGRHFGADLLASMELCFAFEPDRILYATDWIMEPGSVRTGKQGLIEQTRRWQSERSEPARLDVLVHQVDGHNEFLGAYAAENGGEFVALVE